MISEVIFLSEVSHAIDLKAEMTSRTQVLTAKQKSVKLLKESNPRSEVKTEQKSVRRSKKNIAGQVLTYNSKNFY